MAKQDPKYDSKLEKTVFSWGIIQTDVTIANLLKKRAGKSGKSYDPRYVVLSRNYIMYYKPAGKDGPPKKHDMPKGVINLKRVQHNDVRIDADNSSILIPTTAGRVFEFQAADDKVLAKWHRVVKERAEAISKVNTDELTDFKKTIMTVQELFPQGFSLSSRVKIEQIDKLSEDRRMYAQGLVKWEAYVRNASLFLECYFGENRHYMDWFIGPEGPSVVLQKADEEALASWSTDIEKAMKTAPEIAEIRFFSEDLEETAQLCDRAILCVDGINRYSKEFLNKEGKYTEQYVREKEILQKFAASFRSFPSVRTIDFRTSRGGKVVGQNGDEFAFILQGGQVTFKGKSKGTDMLFLAQGPELGSRNEEHGTVMWNGRIWVWYHTRYPHTIRFDYDPKSGAFRYRPSPSASGPKSDLKYADWAMEGGNLRCLGGAGKVAPSCGAWRMEGDVPVCAVLLAGLSEVLVKNSTSA